MNNRGYRNLCVFIDGTGNSDFKTPPEGQTNVARLWHACANDGGNESSQRTYYKPGVGTRDNEGIWGNAAGKYLEDRVSESKSWLINELAICEGDGFVPRIFIFGFSRGAYAARWLANEFDSDIEFLGVWDTVKTTLKGPDVTVASAKIRRIYHALAIDEHRKLFNVTRFRNSPQAVEVWFPGCHSDVGGGYADGELFHLSLNWMVGHATKSGLMVDCSMLPTMPQFAKLPIIHNEAKKKGWRIADWLAGDAYFDRQIASTDIVHPAVNMFRQFDYAPDFLPTNYVVWHGDAGVVNSSFA